MARVLPRSRRAILPDSGHAALLERGMDLATIMRGAGVTARPRQHKHITKPPQPMQSAVPAGVQPPAVQVLSPAAAAAAGNGTETVRVRLPDSSSNKKDKSSVPRIIGVVKDDKALSGSQAVDGRVSPRPATLLPRATKVTAAGAAAPAASSSSSEPPRYTPVAAAGAAAAMAAATAGTGGGAATAAADAGSSGNLAQAAASNGNGSGKSSSTGEQQQKSKSAAVDKDLAWDEWSQILAPWRVS